MLSTILLASIIFLIWSSPEFRSYTANALRITASWVEPNEETEKNPKHFQIPNPFYTEKVRK